MIRIRPGEFKFPDGTITFIDPEDEWRLRAEPWHKHKGRSTFYVSRLRYMDGKAKRVYLHRELIGECPEVDHRDGNGLDNRRNNLRPATTSKNHGGKITRPAHFRSRFRGVYLNKPNGRWCAQIKVNYRKSHLGMFDTQEEAAKAYDVAAVQAFGEFAQLNFPVDSKTSV